MMDSLLAVLNWQAKFTKELRVALSARFLTSNIHIKFVADPCGSAAAFPN